MDKIIDVSKYSISTLNTEDNLLIITCYPFDSLISGTPYRYIVRARLDLGKITK